jgi:hypothetical protein
LKPIYFPAKRKTRPQKLSLEKCKRVVDCSGYAEIAADSWQGGIRDGLIQFSENNKWLHRTILHRLIDRG